MAYNARRDSFLKKAENYEDNNERAIYDSAAIRKRLGIYAGANVEFKLDGNVLRLYRQSLQSSATLAYLNS